MADEMAPPVWSIAVICDGGEIMQWGADNEYLTREDAEAAKDRIKAEWLADKPDFFDYGLSMAIVAHGG